MERLLGWMRDLGAKNVETFSALRSRMESIFPTGMENETSALAKKHYRNFREAMLSGRNERITQAFIGEDCRFEPFLNVDEAALAAPTYFAFAEAFVTGISRTLLPPEHPRKLKRSDFGDMAHAAYIPHVDYFRCDAPMAECFRELGQRFQTVIVTSLNDLFERVGL